MHAMMLGVWVLCVVLGLLAPLSAGDAVVVDVLVYKANPAGVGAAIAAAAEGKHTVQLMEPLTMIGGMGAAGGVGLMNQGCGLAGVTGLGKVWGMLNGAYYNASHPTLNVFPDNFVAELSFWRMLNASSSITTSIGCRLVRVVRGDGGACLTQADFLCDNDQRAVSVNASVFIDASYDGDLMVAAGGIDYTSGREARSKYNESLAGVILLDDPLESFDKQNLSVDALLPNGSFVKGITPEPLPAPGTGDDRLMAFQHFACLSDTPSNMVPFPKPDGYDPADFTLLQRQIDGVVANGKYPNGPDLHYFSGIHYYQTPLSSKVLACCGTAPVDCDEPDLNHGWASANHTERLRIEAAHKYYLLGSLYYMANEVSRVPNYTRYAFSRWGLCKDDYASHGHWPPQLYIRISNRLQGEVLLTQNNIANPRSKTDGVSMGCWSFDQHTMSRHGVPDPKNKSRTIALNEGFMRHSIAAPHLPCTHPEAVCSPPEHGEPGDDDNGGDWYDVPFGVMLPKRGQASNLMIPVALSASSVAYASTRIEGMFMDLGTAAGVAATLLLQNATGPTASCPATPTQDLSVPAIQSVLVSKYQQRIHGPIA